ncbi:MAG: hypothetical protein N4A35_10660 [Flavobacteriales bacterium]|jgi:hypothetical protein|nr:hypothetical protein [Flavobacteriales bacterium]
MKTVLRNSILFIGLITIMTMLSSCYKEKETTAVVTVLDVANAPVPGANVKLYYKKASDSLASTLRLDKEATTDASGKANFNYTEEFKSGQAGLAVLDIEVDGDILGIIKIEEELQNEETVNIP